MTRQTYKTPEPLFVQHASVGGMTPFTYMTHSDKCFRCSIHLCKQASLITWYKPVPTNPLSPVTTKHGNFCGKLLMAMKQRNSFSVTCTSHKLNWVYSIYTISNTDNRNRCNDAAHCCVYSVDYRWQKVMTLPLTFTHHYTGTDEGQNT